RLMSGPPSPSADVRREAIMRLARRTSQPARGPRVLTEGRRMGRERPAARTHGTSSGVVLVGRNHGRSLQAEHPAIPPAGLRPDEQTDANARLGVAHQAQTPAALELSHGAPVLELVTLLQASERVLEHAPSRAHNAAEVDVRHASARCDL